MFGREALAQSTTDLGCYDAGRQDLNLRPILRQAMASFAVTRIASGAALQMRCIQGTLIGFAWR